MIQFHFGVDIDHTGHGLYFQTDPTFKLYELLIDSACQAIDSGGNMRVNSLYSGLNASSHGSQVGV